MALSKKHFNQLAAILKEHNEALIATGMITDMPNAAHSMSHVLTTRIAEFCQSQNPAFNWPRFMEASGIK